VYRPTRPPVFAVGDDKKKGKGRYTKSQVGYISPIWGADPFRPICTIIGTLVGVHHVIIQSKFGFNILRGFRSTGGQNFYFPIDFAGHRYTSADATAQPVMAKEREKSVVIHLYFSLQPYEFKKSNQIKSRFI